MTTNTEEEIQANDITNPVKNMQIVEDSNLATEENMAGISSEDAQTCDVEEGELPEEGEIMDDEDEETKETPVPSAASPKSVVETTVAESQSTTNPVTTTPTTTTSSKEASEPIAKSPTSKEEDLNQKKRGPSSPIGDPYAAKRPALSPDAPQLPPRRRQPWTEAVLCKFFREGYCRDGETCAYSHNAAHSNRKPELCKFYQQGFCKKGLACTLLHGEYPCKAFHEGKCDKTPCKYSHAPLNDYTRVIFTQMVQDEALASQIIIPMQPTKRKVLLRRPLPNAAPPAVKASPKMEEQPIAVLSDSAHDFDPSKFHAENEKNVINEPQPYVAMTSAQDPDEQMVANEASAYMPEKASYLPENQVPIILSPVSPNVGTDASGFSISDMLNQIAESPSIDSTNVINLDDLMKSSGNTAIERIPDTPQSPPRIARERKYRLIPIADSEIYDYDVSFLKKIKSDRFKKDPRIPSIIQKQFDRASSMFGLKEAAPAAAPASSKSPQKTSLLGDKPSSITRDPRVRAVPADPRQRPLQQQPPINGLPASQVPINGAPPSYPINNGPMNAAPVAAMDDAHFKSLVEKQLQMVNEFKLHDSDGGNYHEARYDDGSRSGRFREDEERYGERKDYDRDYPGRGYNDRGNYNGYEERPNRFEEPSYEEDPQYRGPSRYPPPSRGSSTRGGAPRGFHEAERYPRRHPNERFDARWEGGRPEQFRREPYNRERGDRREYGRSSATTGRFRERSRSRSPRRNEPPTEERPLTLREKRKNNEYQSPLARA